MPAGVGSGVLGQSSGRRRRSVLRLRALGPGSQQPPGLHLSPRGASGGPDPALRLPLHKGEGESVRAEPEGPLGQGPVQGRRWERQPRSEKAAGGHRTAQRGGRHESEPEGPPAGGPTVPAEAFAPLAYQRVLSTMKTINEATAPSGGALPCSRGFAWLLAALTSCGGGVFLTLNVQQFPQGCGRGPRPCVRPWTTRLRGL